MTATVEAVRLYSVATVAERLEMSDDWVYDRIKSGDLAVVELGSTRAKQRIRADVLQAFIDSRSFGLQASASPEVAPGGGRDTSRPQTANSRPPGRPVASPK